MKQHKLFDGPATLHYRIRFTGTATGACVEATRARLHATARERPQQAPVSGGLLGVPAASVETTCPNCGAEVEDETLDRCPDCSVPLKVTCANCGEKAPAGGEECPECGALLAHAAEAG